MVKSRYAGQQEESILRGNNSDKPAYAGQLNSFTHLRALLVLHDHVILALRPSISTRGV